jgi:hypothetical protein
MPVGGPVLVETESARARGWANITRLRIAVRTTMTDFFTIPPIKLADTSAHGESIT